MATVVLKNVKKIYPFISGEGKKKKKKKDESEEKKANLQITEQGVVAVQEFNLEIADKEFIVLVGPPAAVSPPRCAWSQVWKRSLRASCISTASS